MCVCVCVYIYIYIYTHTHTHTLTGHFIRYTLLVLGWTPFFLQNCLNSLWHRFNKVLETFLRDFGPYWHDNITQLQGRMDPCVFIRCSMDTKGLKVYQENIPHTLHHHQQPEPLRRYRMDPCFHVLYAKFWPYHLNVAAEIKTHQTRQRFSNLLLSNFGDPVWIVASVSCSYLTGAAPGVVFCCCSSSASGFDVLCVQRWYSAYLGCNEWLFELLLPFYHL